MEHQSHVEIVCVDTWEGSAEHAGVWNMGQVEQNFAHNIELAIQNHPAATVHKKRGSSHTKMIELLADGYEGYFDYVHIDGLLKRSMCF